MSYKTVVGLEIHAQLSTNTKSFSADPNKFGLDPNTATYIGSLGMPGAIPVLSREAVEYAIMAGLGFNCNINKESTFERKKYFYPDLPAGYQVTQVDTPIASDGYIIVKDLEENDKKIRIQRIQIEEDTGKSLHDGGEFAYLDYNRSGATLVEIVSYPDINSPEEAKEFLTKLRNTLRFLEISDGKMEEGSLRCDVNVNVIDEKNNKKSSIIEVKNVGSISAVGKVIEYEANRQIELLEKNETEVRSTRRWDDEVNETVLMRQKFTADNFNYSYDGDVPNLIIDDEIINSVREKMPELSDEKRERFIKEYKLSEYDASILSNDKDISIYYEEVNKLVNDSTLVANYIINELLRRLNDENIEIKDLRFKENNFSDLLNLLKENKINNNTAKKVFRAMFEEGIEPISYIEENNLIQVSDEGFIDSIVDEVLAENPETIEQYLSGKDRVLGFLVGQVMKKSKGKANPSVVNEIILSKIKKQ